MVIPRNKQLGSGKVRELWDGGGGGQLIFNFFIIMHFAIEVNRSFVPLGRCSMTEYAVLTTQKYPTGRVRGCRIHVAVPTGLLLKVTCLFPGPSSFKSEKVLQQR